MKNYTTLLKVDFLNTYSFINKSISTAEKIRTGVLMILALIGAISIGISVGSIAPFLQAENTLGSLLSGLAATSLVISLFSAIRIMSTGLFDSNDYDMLSSMPISQRAILLVKLTRVYFDSTLLSSFLVVPSIIAIGIACKMPILYYFYSLISFIFVPLPSMVIAAILSIILMQLFARFAMLKRIMGFASVFLYILIFIPYFSFTMTAPMNQNAGVEEMATIFSSNNVSGIIGLYPFSGLIEEITINRDFFSFLIFILINLIILALFLIIFQRSYKKVNLSLRDHVNKSNYSHKSYKTSSPVVALIKKDISHFTGASAVITQTIMGGLLAAIFVFVSLYITDSFQDIPVKYSSFVAFGAVAMAAYMSTISPYSTFSISIEGHNFWILKSLPIKDTDIFKSKILITLMINIPIALVVLALVQAKLKIDSVYFILISLVYLIQIVISGIYGMYYNLLFPRMNWDNMSKAVKNSGGVIASVITSFVLLFVLSGIGLASYFVFNQSFILLCVAVILVQLIILTIYTLLLSKHGRKLFKKIPA